MKKINFCLPFFLLLFSADLRAMCWDQAEVKYNIEARLLKSIAIVESGMNAKAKNINSNGSYDIGLMQINSVHLPELSNKGITESQLFNDPCLSIMTAASILSGMINRYGYNWEAVGAYNAGTSESRQALRLKYARNVWKHYIKHKE